MNDDIVLKMDSDGTEILQFKRLLDFPNLKHGYTLRKNGINIYAKNNEQDMIESYKKVAKILNFDYKNIVKPHQTHTDKIEIVNSPNEEFDEVDGLITNKKNIFLCTTSADCISLLFYDPSKKVIADVHSGWRGTLKQIGRKAVEKMISVYSSNPRDIICCIGPCIKKCHFEVDIDVMQAFYDNFKYTGKSNEIIAKGRKIGNVQKFNVDTTLINKIILEEAGLRKENIIDSEICTVCDSYMFHSYRADREESGRNGAFIGIG